MASLGALGVDMNDPITLSYYSRILLFKNDSSQTLISFENPTKPHQRVLQSLAHALDLEYDHNTLIRQVVISRPSLWESNSNGNAGTEATPEWDSSGQNHPYTLDRFVSSDLMADYPILEAYSAELANTSPFSLGVVDEESQEASANQSFDLSTEAIENLPTSEAEQNLTSRLLDDISVDYSVDTVPSLSETSGIAPVSSVSDLYSSHNLSFRNLHDGYQSTSSIAMNDRRGSCQSVHAAIPGFFGSSHRTTSRPHPTTACTANGLEAESKRHAAEDHPYKISVGLGRRGPLGKVARATMKAVKAVKACWRCKVLRKACNPDTPCDTCPKDARRSDWHTLGCKRGDLKDHMLPIVLCPKRDSTLGTRTDPPSTLNQFNLAEEGVNDLLRHGLKQREQEIRFLETYPPANLPTLLGNFLQLINMDLGSLDSLRGTPVSSSSLGRPPSPTKVPLADFILMILWEILSNPTSQLIHDGWTLYEFFNVLIAAALCQVETGNRLIAQSLICLRRCLEAMRMQSQEHLDDKVNQKCNATLCNIQCISSLKLHMSSYLDEFSRVLFAKENLRDIKLWWMSGFYSLCIQGIVRRALLQLVGHRGAETPNTRYLGVKQYLQVTVRLFVASSRVHDPLVRDLPPTASMSESGSWNEVSGALSSIMFLVNRYQNYGIDIHFQNYKSFGLGDVLGGIAPGGYYGVKNISTVTEIFKKVKPGGQTASLATLRDILDVYLTRLGIATKEGEELRPLNLIVIADPVNSPELESILSSVAKDLDEMNAPLQQVGMQLFDVGCDEMHETTRLFQAESDSLSLRTIVVLGTW